MGKICQRAKETHYATLYVDGNEYPTEAAANA